MPSLALLQAVVIEKSAISVMSQLAHLTEFRARIEVSVLLSESVSYYKSLEN